MKLSVCTNTSLLALLCYLASTAPPAFAQSGGDEIIVTATKIVKNPSELGLSIAVVDGETLSKFDGAEDLSRLVPGLQAAVANGSQVILNLRLLLGADYTGRELSLEFAVSVPQNKILNYTQFSRYENRQTVNRIWR